MGNLSGLPVSPRTLRCALAGERTLFWLAGPLGVDYIARGDLTTLRVAQAGCSASIIWPRGPDTFSKVQHSFIWILSLRRDKHGGGA